MLIPSLLNHSSNSQFVADKGPYALALAENSISRQSAAAGALHGVGCQITYGESLKRTEGIASIEKAAEPESTNGFADLLKKVMGMFGSGAELLGAVFQGVTKLLSPA